MRDADLEEYSDGELEAMLRELNLAIAQAADAERDDTRSGPPGTEAER
jgi:hypothetical protein